VHGICSVEGLTKWGSSVGELHKFKLIATLPEECRPHKRLVFNLNNNAKTARVDVHPNGQIRWVAGGKDHAWISLSGISFGPGAQGQTTLPLANGFEAYGSVYGTPTFTVVHGICSVEGLTKWGSSVGELHKFKLIATLPEECRPHKRLVFNLNNNAKTARVDVHPNGQIRWVAGGKDHAWISFSGTSFCVAQGQQRHLLVLPLWTSKAGGIIDGLSEASDIANKTSPLVI